MTSEEIDKVIEKAGNKVLRFPVEDIEWAETNFPVEDIEWGRNKLPYFAEMQDLLAAVKQLREGKTDLANRLTDAQDLIAERKKLEVIGNIYESPDLLNEPVRNPNKLD